MRLLSLSSLFSPPVCPCFDRSGALPFGWERRVLPDGKVLFVDHEGHKTTYADPRLAFAVEESDGRKETFRQRFDASTTAMQVKKMEFVPATSALLLLFCTVIRIYLISMGLELIIEHWLIQLLKWRTLR